MTPTKGTAARPRDAQRAREAILNAAEAVFAEGGFDGARMDAIARASGYNISLLFQYFTDKLGLYAAVLQRAQRETAALQARVLAPLAGNGVATPAPAPAAVAGAGVAGPARDSRAAFEQFLAGAVRTVFDYFDTHPRLLRLLTWEMAGGWQGYLRLAADLPESPAGPFEAVFARARRAGWLRADWPAAIQLTLIFQVCQSYLAFRPLYQSLRPGRAAAPARDRARVVAFVVWGLLAEGDGGVK